MEIKDYLIEQNSKYRSNEETIIWNKIYKGDNKEIDEELKSLFKFDLYKTTFADKKELLFLFLTL